MWGNNPTSEKASRAPTTRDDPGKLGPARGGVKPTRGARRRALRARGARGAYAGGRPR